MENVFQQHTPSLLESKTYRVCIGAPLCPGTDYAAAIGREQGRRRIQEFSSCFGMYFRMYFGVCVCAIDATIWRKEQRLVYNTLVYNRQTGRLGAGTDTYSALLHGALQCKRHCKPPPPRTVCANLWRLVLKLQNVWPAVCVLLLELLALQRERTNWAECWRSEKRGRSRAHSYGLSKGRGSSVEPPI